MKKLWQNKRKAEGKDYSKPNIVMNSAVQVCWEKAARYFEVEERYVYCSECALNFFCPYWHMPCIYHNGYP